MSGGSEASPFPWSVQDRSTNRFRTFNSEDEDGARRGDFEDDLSTKRFRGRKSQLELQRARVANLRKHKTIMQYEKQIPSIMEQLKSPSTESIIQALNSLNDTLRLFDPHIAEYVCKFDFYTLCGNFLARDDLPQIQVLAAMCLVHLTAVVEGQNAMNLLYSSAFPHLVRLVTSPNIELQIHAIWALSNVAEEKRQAISVIKKSGVDTKIFSVISSIVKLPGIWEQMVEEGEREAMSKDYDSIDTKTSCGVLIQSTYFVGLMLKMADIQEDAIDALIMLLPILSTKLSVRIAIISSIGIVAEKSTRLAKLLIDQNYAPMIANDLQSPDRMLKYFWVKAICGIAYLEDNYVEKLDQAGIIPLLVNISDDAHNPIQQKEALFALSNITSGQKNEFSAHFVESNGLEVAIRAFFLPNIAIEARLSALVCIRNTFYLSWENADMVVRAGFVTALVSNLNSPSSNFQAEILLTLYILLVFGKKEAQCMEDGTILLAKSTFGEAPVLKSSLQEASDALAEKMDSMDESQQKQEMQPEQQIRMDEMLKATLEQQTAMLSDDERDILQTYNYNRVLYEIDTADGIELILKLCKSKNSRVKEQAKLIVLKFLKPFVEEERRRAEEVDEEQISKMISAPFPPSPAALPPSSSSSFAPSLTSFPNYTSSAPVSSMTAPPPMNSGSVIPSPLTFSSQPAFAQQSSSSSLPSPAVFPPQPAFTPSVATFPPQVISSPSVPSSSSSFSSSSSSSSSPFLYPPSPSPPPQSVQPVNSLMHQPVLPISAVNAAQSNLLPTSFTGTSFPFTESYSPH
ncbi:uncharacterized protein MONOS_5846 [Monocercomonoides exilis]|uniref:uncharacterized protein n=1 Tax=Monocercomonoides exilis TaxID=2049356 RepID=UPI00355A1884|nr:hypothetical protein MONOS_5846 [Monocercomonoides exilis]|eukprot:MONOS_5846.1-p1 / transcript=MONOS_5846.1 / gene=MONOS_5846 / organism=Monocercomonoides_exilis_PA203 / gene_product=unspecified product / transcript_product=unspecified product / location=Mono_scaffold00175:93622-96622(+) / protein_length=799 / sequence_SO=supercontig / SO=protein_coding / is_pseudo=false